MTPESEQVTIPGSKRGKKIGLHKETLRELRPNASRNKAMAFPCGETGNDWSDFCDPSETCVPTE